MVLVSVVIPVYNQDRYVAAAIDSVLAQTFRDFEVVVVDDGSTDSTPAVLARYASRIRVIRQRNRGGAAALNTGIRAARGEWIAWLSSDDLWEPAKLERQVEVLHREPRVGMVYTDYVYVDADGRLLSRESFPAPPTRRKVLLRLIRRCFINGSSTLIRRAVFDAVGWYDEGDRLAPDWDMWFRIAAAFDIAQVPEPLVRYRIHGEQTSSKRDLMDRASKRVASRAVRRMGPVLGSLATLVLLRTQLRNFPAHVRTSVGGRTIPRQLRAALTSVFGPYSRRFEWKDHGKRTIPLTGIAASTLSANMYTSSVRPNRRASSTTYRGRPERSWNVLKIRPIRNRRHLPFASFQGWRGMETRRYESFARCPGT